MTLTSFDVRTTTVVDHDLVDEPLLTLDALADAAGRLPETSVEHHLADLPRLLPDGGTTHLERSPGDVVRGIESNGCWVMLTGLATLPEYEALLRRAAGRFELALRARGEQIVTHNLVAFVGAPGATVPVHFDRNHHLLMQIRGTKTVGTGTFTDPVERQRQLERGLQEHRLNADIDPDTSEERVLRAGQAMAIPAFLFHWVHGAGDLSIALTCTAGTAATMRETAVHRFNLRARKFGLHPAPPGKHPRVDRVKQRAVNLRDRRS